MEPKNFTLLRECFKKNPIHISKDEFEYIQHTFGKEGEEDIFKEFTLAPAEVLRDIPFTLDTARKTMLSLLKRKHHRLGIDRDELGKQIKEIENTTT